MMKHLFSFLIIASLLLFGCRSKTQSNFQPELSEQAEESYSLPEEYAEEVIVTGKVLNRDFYPNEKDLTLIIPFFRKMENQYCAPIQKDGSFSFRFPIFAKIREISIRNYAEHLYVHPGDSVYVEIDFKDILSCHAVLQDYLEIRESSPLYEEIRGTRRLGIPCFVREDGTMTLNLNDILE